MTVLNSLIACSALLDSSAANDAPSGRYVEVRSASVYAGACHYNSEYVTQGREAVLAWRIERGSHAGVELAGLAVAVAIRDEVNLADAAQQRRSIVYLPQSAGARERDALCAWLVTTHAALLGEVLAVEATGLDVAIGADSFAVAAGASTSFRGNAMPNRECCKMPYNVWYDPFEPLVGRRVGEIARWHFAPSALGAEFVRCNENSASFGAFGAGR
ncbi:MAG: DUF1326 domain-containing protein [Planctomycetota bacterium]|nr:MAG: DUF1326 domain-containing protein [Planctomycetota bacterium]